jgi:galactoside O-acetyltransferase
MATSFMTEQELASIGFKSFGENVLISRKASIYGANKMEIGSNVRIDDFCFLSGRITLGSYIHLAVGCILYGSQAGITMEDFSGLSPRVTIHADSDDYSGESLTNPTTPEEFKAITHAPVRLERHAIVGSGCTLLPGVTLGEGTAIGSMSLVLKSTNPWTINMGIPCHEVAPRSRRALELEQAFLSSRPSATA